MLTGDIRSQIDRIWNVFWTGGISNPLEVIEQITYLLFVRRLDEQHTLEEGKSTTLKRPMERRILPEDNDERGRRSSLSLPAHARRRWLHLRASHEGRALHHPKARAARQGR